MNGFGATAPTTVDDVSFVPAGGHFFGAQTFPAIWLFSASKVSGGSRCPMWTSSIPRTAGSCSRPTTWGVSRRNTVFTNVSISGAQRSGDPLDAKSGFGIWVNEQPGQGPAVGSATFRNLTETNNVQNIRYTNDDLHVS